MDDCDEARAKAPEAVSFSQLSASCFFFFFSNFLLPVVVVLYAARSNNYNYRAPLYVMIIITTAQHPILLYTNSEIGWSG